MDKHQETSVSDAEAFVDSSDYDAFFDTNSSLKRMRGRIAGNETQERKHPLILLLETHGMGRTRIHDPEEKIPPEKIIVINAELQNAGDLLFMDMGFFLELTATVSVNRDCTEEKARECPDHLYYVLKITESTPGSFPSDVWSEIEQRGSAMYPLSESIVNRWIDAADHIREETRIRPPYKTIEFTLQLPRAMDELEVVMYQRTKINGFEIYPGTVKRDFILLVSRWKLRSVEI